MGLPVKARVGVMGFEGSGLSLLVLKDNVGLNDVRDPVVFLIHLLGLDGALAQGQVVLRFQNLSLENLRDLRGWIEVKQGHMGPLSP